MQFPGYKRIRKVYPIWFCLSVVPLAVIVFFKFRYPLLLLLVILAFLIKDIFINNNLIKTGRPRVYWAEHAPLSLLIGTVGALGLTGVSTFQGYVGEATTVLAFADFALNFYKDLIEDPRVYSANITHEPAQ